MPSPRIKIQYLIIANTEAFGKVISSKEAAYKRFCDYLEETYVNSCSNSTEDGFPVFKIPFRRSLNELYIKWNESSTQFQIYLSLEAEESRERSLAFLSKIDQELHEALSSKFYILTIHDEVSSIYSSRLFAKISSFERKFKELMILVYNSEYGIAFYNIVIEETELGNKVKKELKHKSETIPKVDYIQESIWKMELGPIQKFLFDEGIQNRYKTRLDTCNSSEKIIIQEIYDNLVKNQIKSEWDYQFKQYTLGWNAKEDFIIIKNCRNHISHANQIRYTEYKDCCDALLRADKALSLALKALMPERIFMPKNIDSDDVLKVTETETLPARNVPHNIVLDYKVLVDAIARAFVEQNEIYDDTITRSERPSCNKKILKLICKDQWKRPVQYYRKK